MVKNKNKKERSERMRKFIVSLKKRPHNIPFAFMLLTFVVYSFNLTKVSNTTAVINKPFMGICGFCTMLFSILSFVCFLNAFPKRKKPIVPMVVLLYILQAIVLVCDIIYIGRINEGLLSIPLKAKNMFIPKTRTMLIIHAVMIVISVVLITLIPFMKKQFAKIDTSVKLEGNDDIANIELSEGD